MDRVFAIIIAAALWVSASHAASGAGDHSGEPAEGAGGGVGADGVRGDAAYLDSLQLVDGRGNVIATRPAFDRETTSYAAVLDDAVRRRGPRQGASPVARLAAAGPGGRAAPAVRAPLGAAPLPQAVAGRRPGAGGAVEGGAALEFGNPLAQAGVLPDQRRAQAQQPPAPGPDGRTGRRGKGGQGEQRLQAREGLAAGGEVRVPGRPRHGPSSASTAMIAASTARRSPAGMAR